MQYRFLGVIKLFLKGSESKYLWLGRLYYFYHNYSTLSRKQPQTIHKPTGTAVPIKLY